MLVPASPHATLGTKGRQAAREAIRDRRSVAAQYFAHVPLPALHLRGQSSIACRVGGRDIDEKDDERVSSTATSVRLHEYFGGRMRASCERPKIRNAAMWSQPRTLPDREGNERPVRFPAKLASRFSALMPDSRNGS